MTPFTSCMESHLIYGSPVLAGAFFTLSQMCPSLCVHHVTQLDYISVEGLAVCPITVMIRLFKTTRKYTRSSSSSLHV